jgi:hypothetical protein
MSVGDSVGERSSSALLPEGSEQGILEALARRIAEHRLNPTLVRLTQHALDIDPVMRRVYRAARKLDGGVRKDWWTKLLIRAGMSPEEADLASRGKTYSRDSVVREISDLYRQAVRNRSWPGQEITLGEALRMRAKRAFGSARAAREAALRKLGLKKPKKPRELRDASPAEDLLVRTLNDKLAWFLPLDSGAGVRDGASFAAIAGHLGLRGWRKPGYTSLSIHRLIFLALDQDPEILSRLVRLVVKRAVRHRRLRDGWSWSRVNLWSTKQPIWREEVEEIVQILKAAGIPLRDLGDERFLRGLPRRHGWAFGASDPMTLDS